jgi:hypothetical protein
LSARPLRGLVSLLTFRLCPAAYGETPRAVAGFNALGGASSQLAESEPEGRSVADKRGEAERADKARSGVL